MSKEDKKEDKDAPPKTRCFYSSDIELFIEFFKLCNTRNLGTDKEAEREALLLELMKKREFKGCMVTDYNKTQDQIAEHFAETHGKVLNLSNKNNVEQFQKEVEASKMNQTCCRTCGLEMVLVGYGWVCFNQECAMQGAIIHDEPDNQNWTDDIRSIDDDLYGEDPA